MKFLALTLLSLFSLNSFAETVCEYRFNPRLAVTVTKNDNNQLRGRIMWDDKNVCSSDGEICTEIYPGMFNVRYQNINTNTVGVRHFRVRTISLRDDLGNFFRPWTRFGNFVRNARFHEVIIPTPNLSFTWKGKTHQMKCRITSPQTTEFLF